NALHTECFQQYCTPGEDCETTCVWCRAKWAVPQINDAGGSAGACVGTSEGDLNLGAVAGGSSHLPCRL
ncbi:hypothetical protein JB92DRAFT_2730489, partial [Gautieria morchelliformis]